MEMIHCPNCNKLTGFKRTLGFGTFFMVVITLGLWLFLIPLYPARCINCGLPRGSAFVWNLRTNPRHAITVSSVLLGAILVLLMFHAFFKPATEQPAPIIYNHSADTKSLGETSRLESSGEQPSNTVADTIIDVDADSLLAAYNDNENAAQARYENKTMRVTGALTGIFVPSTPETMDMAARGLHATAFVTMRMPFSSPEQTLVLPGIMAYSEDNSFFGQVSSATTDQLKIGDPVTIECRLKGAHPALAHVTTTGDTCNYSILLQDCTLVDSVPAAPPTRSQGQPRSLFGA